MHAPYPPHVRAPYAAVRRWLDGVDRIALCQRQREAESLFRRAGISFSVHGDGAAEDFEQPVPFDVLPRVFAAGEWEPLARGVVQRARALNAFLADVYGERSIVAAGVLPGDLIDDNPALGGDLARIAPPGGVHAHVVAVDVARLAEDRFVVVEDNCRIPSGVSYMLEDRETMSLLFPDLVHGAGVRRIDHYPQRLRELLLACRPPACEAEEPMVVVLTPGPMNGAYYEHFYLADQMGAELVEGVDLHVEDGFVWMRTTGGPQRVDVIYRRTGDDFLDPRWGNKASLIGVPGLMQAYREGKVSLVNAPGAGVADDKAVFARVPDMIRFYLGEEPLLAGARTWCCREEEDLAYVRAHLAELVIKPVQGAGGEGVVIGPHASEATLAGVRAALEANPAGFVAQEVLPLSRCPRLVAPPPAPGAEAAVALEAAAVELPPPGRDASRDEAVIELRHVDFRAFVLCSADGCEIMPGGLTRVAPDTTSLLVNTNLGGGVKDTWVLRA